MNTKTLRVIACVALSVAHAACSAAELDALQGTWESRSQQHDRWLRVVKIIDGHRETVEAYDGDTLLHRHVVTLEEAQADGMTVMHYGEPEVTHGPRKGQRGSRGSFVSKRRGDTWYNVQGLETGGDAPPTVIQFERVGDPARRGNAAARE